MTLRPKTRWELCNWTVLILKAFTWKAESHPKRSGVWNLLDYRRFAIRTSYPKSGLNIWTSIPWDFGMRLLPLTWCDSGLANMISPWGLSLLDPSYKCCQTLRVTTSDCEWARKKTQLLIYRMMSGFSTLTVQNKSKILKLLYCVRKVTRT